MITLLGQMALVGRVALAGVVLGLAWDLYRCFKGMMRFGRRSPALFVLDLVFLAVLGPVAFTLLLVADGAQMRLSTLVGLGTGAVVYFVTLSPLVEQACWSVWAGLGALARRAFGAWWWIVRRSRPWGVP